VRRFGRPAFPMLAAVVALTIFYLFPEHWMCYDWRYLFPLLPSLLVLAATGLTSGLERFGARSVKSSVLYAGCILAFLSSLSWAELDLLPRNLATNTAAKRYYADLINKIQMPVGKSLARIDAPETHILATADAGAVPYYSGWRTIDMV